MDFLKEFRRKDWAEARLLFQEMPEQQPTPVVETEQQNQDRPAVPQQQVAPRDRVNDMVRRFDQQVSTLSRDWQSLMRNIGATVNPQDRPIQGVVSRLLDRRRANA